MEEMEIKISVKDYGGKSICDYGNGKVVELLGYTAEIIEGDIVLTDHDKYIWVALSEINNYNLAPADIPLVEKMTGDIK